MRNVTLTLLAVQSLHRCAFFAFSPSSSLHTFRCVRSTVTRSLHPFVSASSRTNFHFHSSRFSHFLSQALRFDSTQFLRNKTPPLRLSFTNDDVSIELCEFQAVAVPSQRGGAIYSDCPVRITNSLFTDCSADSGGAIATISFLSLTFTTIRNCVAHMSSGGVDLRSEGDVKCAVDLCIFVNNTAKQCGSLYRLSHGSFTVQSTNLSQARALECVGCLEAKYGTFQFRYVVIHESRAASHHGALVVREVDAMSFDNCVWERCEHH
jgi:hypothetical protein